MKILLVEDDQQQASHISKGLEQAGYRVDVAADGRTGLSLAASGGYAVLVLDRMLPQIDGLTVLRSLRRANDTTPVVILSALGEVDDRVTGLRAGGDDYLVKPFSLIELIARIEALLRRGGAAARATPEITRLTVADLDMDLLRRVVTRAGRPVELKPKEFRLLEFLMRHSAQVVTRAMLLEAVWNYHFDPQTNVIDVHISNLRAKIDQAGLCPLIHTVRGAGYRLGLAQG